MPTRPGTFPDSPAIPALIGYDVGIDRPLDGVVVLARNLTPDDTLTSTLELRTIVAVHLIASDVVEEVCCFSGGTDWRDDMTATTRRPGGQAMLDYSNDLAGLYNQAGIPLAESVRRIAENGSTSTAGNLVASKELLELGRRSVLGVLSDELHHRYDRPELLARKVFGRSVTIVPIAFEEPAPSMRGIVEELGNTAFTRAFMIGVNSGRYGNPQAVMRRQRRLERVNTALVHGGFRSTSPPESRDSKAA